MSERSLRTHYALSLLLGGALLLLAIGVYGWMALSRERQALTQTQRTQGEQLAQALVERLDAAQVPALAMRPSSS